ncbi:MAG: hypothetical protein ACLQDY_23250 [Streptosporangiaceae bacterium]
MPEAIGSLLAARSRHLTLNSDGRRHPVLNGLTAFTFVAGIISFALGLVVSAHLFATVLGVITFGVGMGAQMMSATREERIFIIAGVIAAGVGMGMGLAHGGFG